MSCIQSLKKWEEGARNRDLEIEIYFSKPFALIVSVSKTILIVKQYLWNRVRARRNWRNTFSQSMPIVGSSRATCRPALYVRWMVRRVNCVYQYSWINVDYSMYRVVVTITICVSTVPVTGVIASTLGNLSQYYLMLNLISMFYAFCNVLHNALFNARYFFFLNQSISLYEFIWKGFCILLPDDFWRFTQIILDCKSIREMSCHINTFIHPI